MLECLVCVTPILSSFIHGDSVFDHCEEKRREERRENCISEHRSDIF
jgi:hypothetical protein